MVQELRIRRAAVGAAVLALHILVLLVLIAAIHPSSIERVLGVREIVVRLLPAAIEPSQKEKKGSATIPQPTFIVPAAPRAITAAPELPRSVAPPQGDIGALGRYLYNCSGAYYEKLSPREKEHCLTNQWEKEGPNVLLGTANPSPFDAVIAKRNAPFRPIEKPCSVDKPTANLGAPCFDFGGAPNPLNAYGH